MSKKKSPSDPVYERNTHDWARRVIARYLGINTQFKSSTEQWHAIVETLSNIQPFYRG